MIDEDLLSIATDAADQTLKFCDTVQWSGLSGLRSQLQRSAVSVPSNIAEGMGRDESRKNIHTSRDKVRFYLIAFGSLRECIVQLELLKRQRSELINEISSLSGLWVRVKMGLLFAVDGYPIEAHLSRNERLSDGFTGLRKLKFERATRRAVRQSLLEFLSEVKKTDDISLLNAFPLRSGGATCFSLKAFGRFLEKHGRRVSRGGLIHELKSLGWDTRACRFGQRIIRVWFESSSGSRKNISRARFVRLNLSRENTREASGG